MRKAYQLIEELMLLANESCARLLAQREVPTIYRIHAEPDHEKLESFAKVARILGVDIPEESVSELSTDPQQLTKLLKQLADHPKRQVLHTMLLRAMQQACYRTDNIGHYGLASHCYLHFTSPIRRYADLAVHRMLRAMIRTPGQRPVAAKDDEWWESRGGMSAEGLGQAATAASERERAALDVERAVADLYRAAYMRQHLGETFTGTVVAATNGGVYVQLERPFVDVFVKMERLGLDEYELDETGLAVVALRSGDRVELGDSMTVEIEDVSIARRVVFGRRLYETTARSGRSRRKRTPTDTGDQQATKGRRQRDRSHSNRGGRIRKRATTRRGHKR